MGVVILPPFPPHCELQSSQHRTQKREPIFGLIFFVCLERGEVRNKYSLSGARHGFATMREVPRNTCYSGISSVYCRMRTEYRNTNAHFGPFKASVMEGF